MEKFACLRSMTGFAKASRSINSVLVDVEVRAVNGRFLDVKIRSQRLDGNLEMRIRDIIKRSHYRGKIEVAISLTAEACEAALDESQFNQIDSMVSAYTALCRRYGAREEGLGYFLTSLLLSRRVEGGEIPTVDGVTEDAICEVVEEASKRLHDSRFKEGQGLYEDVSKRLEEVERIVEKIFEMSGDLPQIIRTRLRERLTALDASVPLESTRIEQEALLLADRADISEELARLKIHLARCMVLLTPSESKAVGREIDFVIQEIGREVNTIGSKVQHAIVQGLVIDAKSELEKIREQVQNIE